MVKGVSIFIASVLLFFGLFFGIFVTSGVHAGLPPISLDTGAEIKKQQISDIFHCQSDNWFYSRFSKYNNVCKDIRLWESAVEQRRVVATKLLKTNVDLNKMLAITLKNHEICVKSVSNNDYVESRVSVQKNTRISDDDYTLNNYGCLAIDLRLLQMAKESDYHLVGYRLTSEEIQWLWTDNKVQEAFDRSLISKKAMVDILAKEMVNH